ncbi:MAG: molybdopterin-dependent oxidoreductase [Geodermatophilaceae bacterium]
MIDTETQTPQRVANPWSRRLRAAIAGILAAAVALGVAELIAGLVGPNSSPLVVVGGSAIDATPRPVKDFAIRTFGESDKIALVIGTLALIVVFAIVVGLLSLRDRRIGVAGIGLFGAFGALAAFTRPTGDLLDTLPSLLGAVVGIVALLLMISGLTQPAGVTTDDDDGAATESSGGGRDMVASGGVLDNLRQNLGHRDRKGVSMDRRGFFIAGGVAAGVAAVTGGAGTLIQRRFDISAARDALNIQTPADAAGAVPAGADLASEVPGLTPLFTDNAEFYRVDINITVPQVSPTDWSIRIHGRVQNELTFSLADLMARDDVIERDITITCVSNTVGGGLAGSARWIGVPLRNLLDEAGVEDGADQVLTTAVDGFTIGTPTEDCLRTENAMLAFGMNGEPLPAEHGFPVRMLVPGLYGYVSATKWVVDMELTTFGEVAPYWVQREWDETAPIKLASRIDTPASVGVKAGDVMIAGVAWAQTRGIAKVEVRIDGGDWQQAELAAETNVEMWRQWRLPWRAETGQHTLSVRATDQAGEVQTEERAEPFPNGASGWHTLQVFIQ